MKRKREKGRERERERRREGQRELSGHSLQQRRGCLFLFFSPLSFCSFGRSPRPPIFLCFFLSSRVCVDCPTIITASCRRADQRIRQLAGPLGPRCTTEGHPEVPASRHRRCLAARRRQSVVPG